MLEHPKLASHFWKVKESLKKDLGNPREISSRQILFSFGVRLVIFGEMNDQIGVNFLKTGARVCACTVVIALGWTGLRVDARPVAASPCRPVVEAEEELYTYESANNGAGPMWCHGSTCLVRIGKDVFASGLDTLKDVKPLNNCRWSLYKRDQHGWQLQYQDSGRTREPAPMAGFPDGHLFLSANPTLTELNVYSGPARPEILQFAARDPKTGMQSLLPVWQDTPKFTEHSYRSFAADGPHQELILFQNIDYTHAEWAFRDRHGRWAAQGRLPWPNSTDYPNPGPIRVCYPNVMLKNRGVYFCGVSDIIEPYPEWRAFKKQLTGQEWDYDFRRLFFTWTPDITREKFRNWIEIASSDKTCGWVTPGDLWVAPDGAAHIVWMQRAIDERLRDKFFPRAQQSHSLNYAIVRDGQVVFRRALLQVEEGAAGEIAGTARFQPTPDHHLYLVMYVSGTDSAGKPVSENRVTEILPGGDMGPQVRIPFAKPFTSYFTASVRGGSPPSDTVELLGPQAGTGTSMSYGRVRLH